MMPFHRNWKQSRQRHANLRRNSSNCWQCLELSTGYFHRTRLIPVTASHENNGRSSKVDRFRVTSMT
ncbi:hypothetical protein RB213_015691 [Colletotrichum asianum]